MTRWSWRGNGLAILAAILVFASFVAEGFVDPLVDRYLRIATAALVVVLVVLWFRREAAHRG